MIPYTLVDVAPRSPEWFQARTGNLTASVADRVQKQGRKKREESYQRRDLRYRIICERLTGQSQDDDFRLPAHMVRGVEREGDALAAYEAETGQMVHRVGFLQHNTLPIGCSPDGLIGNEGGVETKAPKSYTHFKYWKDNILPPAYIAQVTHSLWVTGADWWDFVSWDDRFPPKLQLFLVHVTRDDVDIPAYETAALAFLEECDKEFQAVRTLAGGMGAVA